MNEVDKLLELQNHDLKIRELKKYLSDIPIRQENEKKRLEEYKNNVLKAEEDIKAKQADLKQKELETESLREKINKLRTQQFEVKTNDAFRAIENEVATLSKQIEEIEEAEISIYDDIDVLNEKLAEQKKILADQEELLKTDIADLLSKSKDIERELEQEEKLKKDKESKIDQEWLTAYSRIISRKDVAIVEVNDGICMGCHLKLPPSTAHKAKTKSAIIPCDFCGRLLY